LRRCRTCGMSRRSGGSSPSSRARALPDTTWPETGPGIGATGRPRGLRARCPRRERHGDGQRRHRRTPLAGVHPSGIRDARPRRRRRARTRHPPGWRAPRRADRDVVERRRARPRRGRHIPASLPGGARIRARRPEGRGRARPLRGFPLRAAEAVAGSDLHIRSYPPRHMGSYADKPPRVRQVEVCQPSRQHVVRSSCAHLTRYYAEEGARWGRRSSRVRSLRPTSLIVRRAVGLRGPAYER